MTSKVIKSSPRPLEAWEAARPGDGVTTRRRGRISKDANTSKDSLLQTSNISDQFTAGNSGLYSIGDEGRKNEQVDLVGKKPARTIPQTGLGKGKSLPKDRRCSQTSRSTLLTRSGTKSRPECRLVSEENSHSGANGSDLPCELPQGFPTPDHVPNHASNDVGDHPDVQQEDSDRPSESTDLDGSTLQDIDGDVHLPDGVAITGTPLKVLDSGYPSDFESSDPSDKEMTENVYMDDINLAVDELCKANRVSSLIAGIALKGAILPNSGDIVSHQRSFPLDSALAKLQSHFNTGGHIGNPPTAEARAEQLLDTVKAVLLKKKQYLQNSREGYRVGAFLCSAAELTPHLYSVAEGALGTSVEEKEIGVTTAWEALVWIMETCVSVDDDDIPWGWSPPGISAMKSLDGLMWQLLQMKIDLAPAAYGENLVPMRHLDTDWVKPAYWSLRLVAGFAEGAGLGRGEFLSQTMSSITAFLNHASEQVERGRKYTEMESRAQTSLRAKLAAEGRG